MLKFIEQSPNLNAVNYLVILYFSVDSYWNTAAALLKQHYIFVTKEMPKHVETTDSSLLICILILNQKN